MKRDVADSGDYRFFDRDLSWLSFNERVLNEAQRSTVPLMERIRFLSIYSSNMDEFYRVRMPALMALNKITHEGEKFSSLLSSIHEKILSQQEQFGSVIKQQILKELRDHQIYLVYDEPIPRSIVDTLHNYFIHTVAGYIHVTRVSKGVAFFPENNKLYLAVTTDSEKEGRSLYIVNIPSDTISRFYNVHNEDKQYIVFLDDIVKHNLVELFPDSNVVACHSFKITRDAELDLEDEFSGNLARKIEKKISQRDLGLATRFLFHPDMPLDTLEILKDKFNLKGARFVTGGAYHNLKDLSTLPLHDDKFNYEAWPRIQHETKNPSLFREIKSRDILLHPPYHAYDTVLRFFNEAAIDPLTERIYVTLYRIASDSRIAAALISAAKNGKKVVVFVELKARFDEANNIKWAKKMKAAGVRIIESIPGLKVHAKLALVKRKNGKKKDLLGLLATGNFNESTARFYTDHILMTSRVAMLEEMETLFRVLKKREREMDPDKNPFMHLLVGKFNLQHRFLQLIDREISNACNGLPATIVIKFNNLEDRVLITKLYEASGAGVKISLILRGICCLVPGIPGMSENIFIRRIVDRYLEHGRIFIFHNSGNPEVYLGSADWMNRNIYRRIEVCFPLHDEKLKREVQDIVDLQLKDNCQAVLINEQCENEPLNNENNESHMLRSQRAIGDYLQGV